MTVWDRSVGLLRSTSLLAFHLAHQIKAAMVPSTTSSLMRAAAVRSVIRQNQRMGARSARQASHAAAAADHGDSQYPEEGGPEAAARRRDSTLC